MVEPDPYGGDLALRCAAPGGRGEAFPPTPTVLTLATEARTAMSPGLVASKAHDFTGSTRIVPGHFSAEQAAGVKNWTPLAEALRMSASRVVADLGRIHSSSPTMPIAAAADVLVVVTRPEYGAVLHLKDRLERLAPVLAGIRNAPPIIVPVVVTAKRQANAVVAEVGRMLEPSTAARAVAGIGWIALDPAGVDLMYAGEVSGKNARTPLMKSAGVLNDQINQAGGVGPYAPPAATPVDTYAVQMEEA
ncbi:hypothetical protein J2X46_003951 [Nocardioides sp. BE266]|uniref:hypothetical protein n=1 Tax=Nocardioides sp. BE266 TaxID=2817725 RepID=UPI00285BE73E|nr:hypothetical protein [Nocardioides sp. BE266]MDR7254949.1 hypothetical protein [Nocardioides sp. BE266]